jgi:hypothetical protein
VGNEEKPPSESPGAGRESGGIPQDSYLGAGIAHSPRVSASVLRGLEDNGPSKTIHDDGSWKSHALEEDESGGRGRLRRTLRRWFGR